MKLSPQLFGAAEQLAFHMARGQIEHQGRRGKGIRREPEAALPQRLDHNPALAAAVQRQGVQQIRWFCKIDATQ